MSQAVDLNQFTPKQQCLVRELPKHEFNFVMAGIAAGYSKSYAEKTLKLQTLKNTELCRAIEEVRLRATTESLDDVKLVTKTMRDIVNSKTGMANRIRAADILMKMAGVYSEKRVIEQTHRIKELDAAEQAEAQLIAGVRLTLPCPEYTPQDIVGDDSSQATRSAPLIDGKTGEIEDEQHGNNDDSSEPEQH